MGLIDEIKNHDEQMISTVVLPLLNVSRQLPDGTVNPREPNQQVICATSAWTKTSYAYDRLIDDFELSIIDPSSSFVMSCDYRVPQMHGLLSKDFIKKLKLSPSFNENTFATEYMSYWLGANEESWFDFNKMLKYRKIKNPEKKRINREHSNFFYLLSTDVGRIHDQTVVSVFKVFIQSNGTYISKLVNIVVLGRTPETKAFSRQALDLKKLIKAFDPKEVVIDTNGLGVGLADEMIKTQVDEKGEEYGPLGFFNDNVYKEIQPKDCPKILYSLKANGGLNSKIHSNAYTRVNSGFVYFLIKEQAAKSALLATKVGQKMTPKQRAERLLPHEMTSRLMDEIANLRIKKTTGTDIVLERINSRYPKDKYSSFSYGLWRIKELEEESYKRKTKQSDTIKKFFFFAGGD